MNRPLSANGFKRATLQPGPNSKQEAVEPQ